jgi:hypothetical protein
VNAVPGQPPQRVCPRCSTIARTVDAHCPFCGSSYRRRGPWGGVAAATMLATLAILAGVALMFLQTARTVERELDSQVDTVQRDFDHSVRRLETRIDRKLDERLPSTGTTTPGAATPPGG